MHSTLAFFFPGQGSQSKGMLDAHAASHPTIVAATLDEASEALGYDMASLIRDDAGERLNTTESWHLERGSQSNSPNATIGSIRCSSWNRSG